MRRILALTVSVLLLWLSAFASGVHAQRTSTRVERLPDQLLQTESSPEPTASPEPSPSVSPSEIPTPSPEPTSTPLPSESPTPVPSPTSPPSASPVPSPSTQPSPTLEPTPIPTPSPIESPSPLPTVKPSPIPRVSETLSPSPTPVESPAPTPQAEVPMVTRPEPPPRTMESESNESTAEQVLGVVDPSPSPSMSPTPSPSPYMLTEEKNLPQKISAPSLSYLFKQHSSSYDSTEPLSPHVSQALGMLSFVMMTAGSLIFRVRI